MSKSAEYDLIIRMGRLEQMIRNGDRISNLRKQLRGLKLALHLLDIVPTKEEHRLLKLHARTFIEKTEHIIAEKSADPN